MRHRDPSRCDPACMNPGNLGIIADRGLETLARDSLHDAWPGENFSELPPSRDQCDVTRQCYRPMLPAC